MNAEIKEPRLSDILQSRLSDLDAAYGKVRAIAVNRGHLNPESGSSLLALRELRTAFNLVFPVKELMVEAERMQSK